MSAAPGPGTGAYWPGPWPAEDGGPRRLQVPRPGGAVPNVRPGCAVEVVSRTDPVITMAVTRDAGEVYLLRHGIGDGAPALVERIDPDTLAPLATSAELAGGPLWPGSLGAHANGSLYVVFGNQAHRLAPDLTVLASTRLPRDRPYNGFLVLPDGTLVTKDFAGARPSTPVGPGDREPCELVALDPEDLTVLDRCELAEPSVARLSALGAHVYVVGDTGLLRVAWDGRFRPDDAFRPTYRTLEGQSYGWDCVLALGAAWFLDDGDGSEGFDGSLRGKGLATAPLHLVRIDLDSGAVTLAEICGEPGGLVANPPLVDPGRGIVVGYDSGNGAMRAFDVTAGGTLSTRWDRRQDHASHLVFLPDAGAVVSGDHDPVRMVEQVVVLDITTGDELLRTDTEGPLQSVVFPSVGHDGAVYWCSLSTVSRLRFS